MNKTSALVAKLRSLPWFPRTPIREPIRVLLVEGNPKIAQVVRRELQDYEGVSFAVDSVNSTEACLRVLNEGSRDLILIDHDLPGEDAITFLLRVRRRTDVPPVIALLPDGYDLAGAEAIRCGAFDYFPKGLAHAIHQSLDWQRWEAEAGQLREELRRSEIRDELTGLYSKRFLAESLEREVSRARRYERDISVLMLDLDNLKLVNQVHGREAGDSALRHAAGLIGDSMRTTDVLGRYEEDQFCVLLTETCLEGAQTAAERLRFTVASRPVTIGKTTAPLTASIGVYGVGPRADHNTEAIFDRATSALEQAKSGGGNRVRLFSRPAEGQDLGGNGSGAGRSIAESHSPSSVVGPACEVQPRTALSLAEPNALEEETRDCLEAMWGLLTEGARRALKAMASQPDGIPRQDLVDAIGADTGRALAGYLASVRSACGRRAAALPYEMRGNSYAMDRRVARLILAL